MRTPHPPLSWKSLPAHQDIEVPDAPPGTSLVPIPKRLRIRHFRRVANDGKPEIGPP